MDKRFELMYLQRPKSSKVRCEVTTDHDRCPEVATHILRWRDRSAFVCEKCLPGWVLRLGENDTVIVEKIRK